MDFQDAFEAVRAERNKTQDDDRWCPAVDEAALVTAKRIRDKIGGLPITLSFSDWGRLTAIIQREVATAIRHSIYDPPPLPEPIGNRLQRDCFDQYKTDRYLYKTVR